MRRDTKVAREWLAAYDASALEPFARVLAVGVERARAKLEYSPLATAFCEEQLTVASLRKVYEAVWGVPLDPRNFHHGQLRRDLVSVVDMPLSLSENAHPRSSLRPPYRCGQLPLVTISSGARQT